MPVKQEKLRPQERSTPAPALRKVQFGSIAKKKPEGRASYPLLPDPQGQYAAIAARIIDRAAQVEAIAGALDLDKAELKTLATPFYFTNGQGKLDVPSSVAVLCASGQIGLVTPIPAVHQLLGALPANRVLPGPQAREVRSERRALKAPAWPVLPVNRVLRVPAASEARSERPAPQVT
jgi:hypothetical protein